MIDGNTLLDNTLDKQSVNACDSSPVDMQTPEEFKAKVWGHGAAGSYDLSGLVHLRGSFFGSIFAGVSKEAASTMISKACVLGNPIPWNLNAAIAHAHSYGMDLVLYDELLTEIDRWEYKP